MFTIKQRVGLVSIESVFHQLLTLSLLFLLFWEWLKPLPELTPTENITLFLFFFLVVWLAKALRLPWYLNIPLLIGVCLYLVHQLYYASPFFSGEWLVELYADFLQFVQYAWQKQMALLPFSIRTFGFFLLVWYMAGYLFVHRHRRMILFSFFVSTLAYLAILDTFTSYEGELALIRTMLFGLLLLGVNQLHRLKQRFPTLSFQGRKLTLKWLVASFVLVALLCTSAYYLPKAEPDWPDPFRWFTSFAELTFGPQTGWQKVGYGENDEHLGGGFVRDDSPVFHALIDKKVYWRGESKDFYTGHGWERTEQEEVYFVRPQETEIQLGLHPASLLEKEVQVETLPVRVELQQPFARIFYPGDVRRIDYLSPNNVYVLLDPNNGQLSTWKNENFSTAQSLTAYSLMVDYPHFQEEQLRSAYSKVKDEGILRRYTQLPADLPTRVAELAREITHDQPTVYDQAKAIEAYFQASGFRYETKDVAVPGPDQDYVDQFLFETRRGYCDNFSTSMVVMLRTLGIPARWVKGFSSGEVLKDAEGELYTQVKSSDAHSWVEVYFPGSGWIPFEPTKTFNNPYAFTDQQAEQEGKENNLDPFQEKEDLEEKDDIQQEENKDRLAELTNGIEQQGKKSMITTLIRGFVVITGLILILALLYRQRYKVMTYLLSRYDKAENSLFLSSYETLLVHLGRFVLPRQPTQTVREYITALENRLKTEELRMMTKRFEELRYGAKEE